MYVYPIGVIYVEQYTFSQPGYYNKGISYVECRVQESSPVHRYVALFYEAEQIRADASFPVIPDGCIDMVISYVQGHCMGISICGSITSMYRMTMENADYFFGMRFRPGCCPFLKNASALELLDSQELVRMSDLDYSFAFKLMSAKNFAERIALTSQYVCRAADRLLYTRDPGRSNIVDYAVEEICRTDGNISIRQISADMVYSSRYLETVFKAETGFTPKYMSRIIRANHAVTLLLAADGKNRTEVSAECGYSDLSHMNRELKGILGLNSARISIHDFLYSITDKKTVVYKF